ncbi:lipoyltransferase and lipoate-protein ligase subfamily protein [Cyclospora cayetanensis]|uniref:Lipoyltransferase and lipoate-protein ligase subfamily protein n=1 Tax=Cyclospora cayetanensis TaxID=88456 RepID=A0A1D3CXD0_9EIME|nr:lipoyltransferase and lipoate-protein ligase subfamily protein [Cyclospora cayetanensis]
MVACGTMAFSNASCALRGLPFFRVLPLPRGVSFQRSFPVRHFASAATTAAPKATILLGTSTDITFNLAVEAYLKDVWTRGGAPPEGAVSPTKERGVTPATKPPEEIPHPQNLGPLLYLWRNEKTIVIGRHQNAWKEANIQQLQKEGVKLARRYSGGGAVYQDLGNTCFTVISGGSRKDETNAFLLSALKEAFGIDAEHKGRNDLVSKDGRKFSGAAFATSGGVWLHHGTLMRDVDMEALGRLLTPNKAKLRSKGIESVTSRVVNLRELNPSITHENVCPTTPFQEGQRG